MPSSEPHESTPSPTPLLTALVLASFFASGFAALCYEIVWIREAALIFGSTNQALSTVLAVFFLGWAIGSRLFGWISTRTDFPLRWFAGIEIAIGVFALLSPWLFAVADSIYGSVYASVYQSAFASSSVRGLLVLLCLLIPTVLMGGTLPLLCRHFITTRAGLTSGIGSLYGINTLGGALGCAVCGFAFLPDLGIEQTVWIAAIINLVVGFLTWFTAPRAPLAAVSAAEAAIERAARTAEAEAAQEPKVAKGMVAAIFFGTGFLALGYEIVWTRYLSLFIPNSVHTYTLTLTLVLLGIGIGGPLAGWLFRRSQRNTLPFGLVQMLIGLAVLALLLHPVGTWAEMSARFAAGDTTRRVVLFAGVMLLPAILLGMAFPLAVRLVVDTPRDAGQAVGRMTLFNTLGGVLGSLGTGFLLIPGMGIQATIVLLTILSVMLGFAAFFARREARSGDGIRFSLATAGILVWSLLAWTRDVDLPKDLLAGSGRVLAFVEGAHSNLAVVRHDGVKQLEIDGLWQGEERGRHLIMSGHLPMLIHPDPKRVLAVGLGVGHGARRFLMHDIEQLDCLDIEANLPGLVAEHFDGAWLEDPRVRVVIEDGRNYVAHTDQEYDVISLAVGQTFRPGAAAFYTAEFYAQARRRLRPNGLLVQFVPTALLTPDEFRTVIATFVHVFPQSALWYNTSEMLLVGHNADRPVLPAQRLTLLTSDAAIHADLSDSHWGGPADALHHPDVFLGCFLSGPRGLKEIAGDAPIYSDDRPWLEYSTARPILTTEDQHALLDLVDAHVDDLAPWLDAVRPPQAQKYTRAYRAHNLGDLRAMLLTRAIERGEVRDAKDAEKVLRKALELSPRNVAVHRRLAYLLLDTDRGDEAIEILNAALAIHPKDAYAHSALGNAHAARGDDAAAIQAFERATRFEPGLVSAHINLGQLRIQAKNEKDGLDSLRTALALDPENAQTHTALGNALIKTGDPVAGIQHLMEALRLQPNSPALAQNLTWNLGIHHDPRLPPVEESIHMAETMATATRHQSAAILDILAANYAKAGRFDEAVRWANRAIELAQAESSDSTPELVTAITARRDLYQSGKPYDAAAR